MSLWRRHAGQACRHSQTVLPNAPCNCFAKHGTENIAYWTEDVDTSNRLVYLLGYPNLGAREQSWTAFYG